jgi:hypothetical protein
MCGTGVGKIQPLLSRTSTSVIAKRIGVSRWYAGTLRRGYRPHPRHWQALAELVSSAVTISAIASTLGVSERATNALRKRYEFRWPMKFDTILKFADCNRIGRKKLVNGLCLSFVPYFLEPTSHQLHIFFN